MGCICGLITAADARPACRQETGGWTINPSRRPRRPITGRPIAPSLKQEIKQRVAMLNHRLQVTHGRYLCS